MNAYLLKLSVEPRGLFFHLCMRSPAQSFLWANIAPSENCIKKKLNA
ncbi:hypothetical protein SynBIOSE41_00915 [Synechococcus sp. BIOS-E4-1]|nr:hypothetical protein SynBIOSE41_00915 [Synechococcus sp. BIOS-E4-1]